MYVEDSKFLELMKYRMNIQLPKLLHTILLEVANEADGHEETLKATGEDLKKISIEEINSTIEMLIKIRQP